MKTTAEIRTTGMQTPMAALSLVKTGRAIRLGLLRGSPPHGQRKSMPNRFLALVKKAREATKNVAINTNLTTYTKPPVLLRYFTK